MLPNASPALRTIVEPIASPPLHRVSSFRDHFRFATDSRQWSLDYKDEHGLPTDQRATYDGQACFDERHFVFDSPCPFLKCRQKFVDCL